MQQSSTLYFGSVPDAKLASYIARTSIDLHATPHSEHSCDVCKLPVAVHKLIQRCEDCDYDMCCVCAAPMKHPEGPTKVPTELPTDMPTELLTEMTTELADGQADEKRTAILQDWQHAATINISEIFQTRRRTSATRTSQPRLQLIRGCKIKAAACKTSSRRMLLGSLDLQWSYWGPHLSPRPD